MLYERFNLALKNAEMNKSEIARLCGVSRSTIGGICSGDRKTVTAELGVLYAKALGVSFRWLVTGKGSMKPGFVGDCIPYLERNQLRDVDAAVCECMVNHWPDPDENKMLLLDFKELPNTSSNTFAYIIEDESMSPRLNPGDTIIVDPQIKPEPGDLVIAYGQTFDPIVRRYSETVQSGNEMVSITLKADNNNYSDIPLITGLDDWCIIGKVVLILGILK